MVLCPRCFDSDMEKINIVNCEKMLWDDYREE